MVHTRSIRAIPAQEGSWEGLWAHLGPWAQLGPYGSEGPISKLYIKGIRAIPAQEGLPGPSWPHGSWDPRSGVWRGPKWVKMGHFGPILTHSDPFWASPDPSGQARHPNYAYGPSN